MAAVSVKLKDSKRPVFGAIWITASLDVDRDTRIAVLKDIRIPNIKFADEVDTAGSAIITRLLEEDIEKANNPQGQTGTKETAENKTPEAVPAVIVRMTPAELIVMLLPGPQREHPMLTGVLQQNSNQITSMLTRAAMYTKKPISDGSSVRITAGSQLTNLHHGHQPDQEPHRTEPGQEVQEPDLQHNLPITEASWTSRVQAEIVVQQGPAVTEVIQAVRDLCMLLQEVMAGEAEAEEDYAHIVL